MFLINHRINNLVDLENIPNNHGIEVDVRYHENELILNHDPFGHHDKVSTKLRDLLKKWEGYGPLILNVKTEGIEKACIKVMDEYKVQNWFFLDMSMPSFIKYSEKAFNDDFKDFSIENLAVRFSDKEPIEYALSFKNKARWIWVDYYFKFPLNHKTISLLKNAKFKICLVSPELQEKSIFTTRQLAEICMGFNIDAVCTKNPELWFKSRVKP